MPVDPPLSAPVAVGRRGAVVAPHHLATTAGLQVLDQGGSAVDAAIATNAALGVVAPYTCGLGGDAFWLAWDAARGLIEAIEGVGRAARTIDPDHLRAAGLRSLPVRGPLPITVPGAVRSWRDAHVRHGQLPLATILAPAQELAAAGFAGDALFARSVEALWDEIAGEPWAPAFGAIYRPQGRPWRVGETVRQPALAATLARLGDVGLDDLYEGGIAGSLATTLAAAGSLLDATDLAGQASRVGPALAHTYRGVEVVTHPLPSCGALGLLILAVLERFAPPPRGSFRPAGWDDPDWLHLGIEAATLALVERESRLGDPEAVGDRAAALLDPASIDALARRIDPRTTMTGVPPITTLVGGTAYVATVDEAGNAVSLITSNASGFGSGVVDATTGIAFHDRGQGFSLDPGHPNALAPRKRPLHSLLPAMILRDGRPWIVVGSMGGDSQPQILAQVVSAIVDGGADIDAAIAAPRWSVEPRLDPAAAVPLALEAATPATIEADLRAMGHAVVRLPTGSHVGHCHAIAIDDDGYRATTDPRSLGRPAVR